MNISLDLLEAFTQAAQQGSFSAAARKLGKSQSTISEAIARLEIDLNVKLFDRKTRQTKLTEAGKKLLSYANDIFIATDRFNNVAIHLSSGLEARLTLAVSETYQSDQYKKWLKELDQNFPDLEFECIVAEYVDVLNLVTTGRADLGLLVSQSNYPQDIAHADIPNHVDFGIFVAKNHPLAQFEHVSHEQLASDRHINVKMTTASQTFGQLLAISNIKRTWSAANYLIVLEMVSYGFGWAELPYDLVNNFGHNQLKELSVIGWPYSMAIDVVWSRKKRLGKAGNWILDKLLTKW